jgi:prepilin-type N-terminal cleavage/methylation domain-containing protein
MFKKQLNRERGFTLIEMVIVIVVIGILMGLAFQSVASLQQNARDTRRLADLRKVQTFLELYYGRCGHYPTAAACGTPSATAGSLTWVGTGAATLETRLAEVVNRTDVPDDPLPGVDYVYRYGANGVDYVVAADTERVGNNRSSVTGTILTVDCNNLYCLRN